MNKNKDTTINNFRLAIAGVQKHFANAPTIALDGAPMAPKDVIATFQAAIDAIDAAAVAEKAFHDAVAAEHAALAKGTVTRAALRRNVTANLGSGEGVQGDFGFPVPKRKAPDAATKAEAVAKRRATRAKRQTMGKRQKAKAAEAQPPAAKPA